MPSNTQYLWESEVRGYELDSQNIVNNANYFHYFDHVRTKHLHSKGVHWCDWHEKGFDLVLAHCDISFKSSLKAYDQFYVTSDMSKAGKLKIMFEQSIYRKEDNKLVSTAINTVVCVNRQNGRPTMPEELEQLLFADIGLNTV